MSGSISLLERRISEMEKNVLGEKGKENQVLEVMSEVNETIENFAKNRERFNQIFKRVPAIETYLSPGFMDTISHDKDCEKQFILAVEDDIKTMSAQLEEINVLTKVLDNPQIQDVTQHEEKLKKLEIIQEKQISDLLNLDQNMGELLASYNQTTSALSEIFTKLDWSLSQMEEKKSAEKDQ